MELLMGTVRVSPAARDDLGYIKTDRVGYARGLGRAQSPLNICCMDVHFMRSLHDRYEVIYNYPSPMAMIPRAEATIQAENFQSSSNDHSWARPAEFTRDWESSSASALECIVSMTGY